MKKALLIVCVAALSAAFTGGYMYGSHRTKEAMLPNYLIGDKYKVVRTPGGMIEVATLRKQESFAWQTSWTCPANLCAFLPTTNSVISATANYTYRIRLSGLWVLEKKAGSAADYVLRVPRLEPSSPVAIDLQTLKVQNAGSVFAPSGPEQTKMQAHMQPLLLQKALSTDYTKAQTDAAKITVAEFARKWMRDGDVRLPDDAKIEVEFGK